MPDPLVDLTIPVHSTARPIARAVASVVDHTDSPIRVTVVAHNIDPALIEQRLGAYAHHPRVRILALSDGIPSPAGPMNYGLSHAEAEFVGVMGSDDELAPGAVDSWLSLARETRADAILARIEIGPRMDPYPPVRNGRRTKSLSARKDRLSYRSAPLGLIDRRRFGYLRFTEGLPSGEDLAYSAELWFTAQRTAYDRKGPAYVVHSDAEDRVTFTPRSVAEDFAFLDAITSGEWFARLGAADRSALMIKVIRVHFFDAVLLRLTAPGGLEVHGADLASIVERAETIAPGVLGLLARVDHRVIEELRSANIDADRIRHLLDARWHYLSFGALMTRNPFLVLHRQSPLRTLWAGLRSIQPG